MKTNVAEAFSGDTQAPVRSEEELRVLEETYCSHGDTVHYTDKPKFLRNAKAPLSTTAQEHRFWICRCGIPPSISAIATSA